MYVCSFFLKIKETKTGILTNHILLPLADREMKNLVAALTAAIASTSPSLAYVPHTLLSVVKRTKRTTTTRIMSSSSSSSDNKSMAFLKKIGRVGGDANIDFVDVAGTDEGSTDPSITADRMIISNTVSSPSSIASSSSPSSFASNSNPSDMICPQLSLQSPTTHGTEIAVVACG